MPTADLIVQWVLPTLATAILLVAFRSGWPGRWPTALWRHGRLPVFLATRLLYAVLLFVILDYWAASDAFAWKTHSDEVRLFSVPLKPLSIALSLLVLWMVWRARRPSSEGG